MGVCNIDSCEMTARGKGLCSKHYTRLRRYGSVAKPVRTPWNKDMKGVYTLIDPRGCMHADCENKHDSHGYCANHARQFKKYGHPLSEQEKSDIQSKAATKRLLKYYAENPDRPKRKIDPEKREAMKGVCKNSGRTHFRKGHIPWCKGLKDWLSEDHLEILREANTGKVPWNKGRVVLEMRGDKNPNWKGGTSRTERQVMMGRIEYIQWRNAVFIRDNFTCQVCNQYAGYLHADHIQSWAEYEDLRFEVSNGRTLCVPCHYYVTFKKKMPVGSLWCNYRLTRKGG